MGGHTLEQGFGQETCSKALKVVFFVTKVHDIFVQVMNFEGVGGDAKEIFYCSVVFVAIYGICTYLWQQFKMNPNFHKGTFYCLYHQELVNAFHRFNATKSQIPSYKIVPLSKFHYSKTRSYKQAFMVDSHVLFTRLGPYNVPHLI